MKLLNTDCHTVWKQRYWISPLIIDQYQNINFWVIISGVDDKENFEYLLQQNLRIEGLPQDSIDLITDEWLLSIKLCKEGVSYEDYLAETPNLQKNKFMNRFMNGGVTEEGYYDYLPQAKELNLDPDSGLPVYIDDFEGMLSKVNVPTLAIFGEKDMNVDWRKTKRLYEATLGKNTDLTIRTFPDANHNMYKCVTGGFYEFQDDNLPWVRPEGFLESIRDWLQEKEEVLSSGR